MTVYSLAQVYKMALNAGFKPGNEAAQATAIAYGESSFNDNAVNYNGKAPGVSTDYGMMQINSHYWPNMGTSALLGDAQTSMNDAYSIYKQKGNFSDWLSTSDGNSAYASMLPKAQAYAQGTDADVTPDAIKSNGNGSGGIPNGSLSWEKQFTDIVTGAGAGSGDANGVATGGDSQTWKGTASPQDWSQYGVAAVGQAGAAIANSTSGAIKSVGDSVTSWFGAGLDTAKNLFLRGVLGLLAIVLIVAALFFMTPVGRDVTPRIE